MNEFFHPDDTGGTGTVLSDLVRTLRARYNDVEVDVLTSRHRYRGTAEALSSTENWDGVHITRLAAPRSHGRSPLLRLGANLLFTGAALLALLCRRRYDLLLVSTAPPTAAIAALIYRRLTGTPYLYTIYDLYPDCATALDLLRTGHPLARLLRRGQALWLHGADRIVVLGRCMRDHLQSAYAVPKDLVDVIPVGADPAEIVPCSKDTAFRRRHALTGFVVCYAGNFGRYHDFDTILDAAHRLQQTGSDVTFLLVGDGAQKRYIARRLENEGARNVLLFPFVPRSEYADLLASADALLVTLETGLEGLGVPSKFYSILASGRPTLAVVSPRCEVALVLAETGCGVQMPQGDAEALEAAICRLAADPKSCDRMGLAARQALIEHYSLQRVADRYYDAMIAASAAKPAERLSSQSSSVRQT